MHRRSLVINERDNVLVLLENGFSGDTVTVNDKVIVLLENIEFGHKMALIDFNAGDTVYKYGEDIGYAVQNIKKGAWIHNHNMGCRRGK